MIHINVLSLFDGISCGRLAMESAGIKVDNYFASEVDENAIKIALKNYPNINQLGDVTKWDEWDLPNIDLIIGGSPCTFWSVARKDRETTSDGIGFQLFKCFADSIQKFKPKYFLYENNYSIHKNIKEEITKYLGVEPVMINSSLVSGQNRKRMYWTNIPFEMPEDRNIKLSDILESGIVDREKSLCVTRRYAGFSGSQSYLRRRYFGKSMGQAVFENTTPEEQKSFWKKDTYGEFECDGYIRQMTPIECERLQTLPDNYTEGISDNARYEAIGNGWTVDVVTHILSYLK